LVVRGRPRCKRLLNHNEPRTAPVPCPSVPRFAALAAQDSIAAGQRKPGEFIASLVGAEYARALFGMLMHEEDARLDLLPGVPPSWVAGEGLRISELPTAFGTPIGPAADVR